MNTLKKQRKWTEEKGELQEVSKEVLRKKAEIWSSSDPKSNVHSIQKGDELFGNWRDNQ